MIKKFIRIFHPIGQGAFYTEKIVTDVKDYNIVYDCGSSTLMPPRSKGDKLKKYINNAFLQNEEIDLLFLSHFHADHINGLDFLKARCKIKKVVMPLLDDTVKALARISLTMDGGNTAIIHDPHSYFGSETEIIQVNPFSEERLVRETENRQQRREYNIETLADINRMNSGDLITIAIDWYYIPYNYEMTDRLNKFIDELSKVSLSISDIDTTDKIIVHKEKITKAYEKVKPGFNSHSLILYSGNSDTRIRLFNANYYPYHPAYSGCLYLGDIDLNQKNIVEYIKSCLHNYWGDIFTIQIPHHGSIENFNDSILSSSIRLAVLSYGTTNTYGHPSSIVQANLILKGVIPLYITEFQNSIVIQFNNMN